VTQFVVFACAGAIATGVHFTILAALVHAGLLTPVPASCVGALGGALVSYALNRRYTFRSRAQHHVALPRFLVLAAVAFVLNAAVLALVLRVLPVHYLVAQALTTGCVMLFTFSGGRLWVFAESPRTS
jgi:putative flippase GtrA